MLTHTTCPSWSQSCFSMATGSVFFPEGQEKKLWLCAFQTSWLKLKSVCSPPYKNVSLLHLLLPTSSLCLIPSSSRVGRVCCVSRLWAESASRLQEILLAFAPKTPTCWRSVSSPRWKAAALINSPVHTSKWPLTSSPEHVTSLQGWSLTALGVRMGRWTGHGAPEKLRRRHEHVWHNKKSTDQWPNKPLSPSCATDMFCNLSQDMCFFWVSVSLGAKLRHPLHPLALGCHTDFYPFKDITWVFYLPFSICCLGKMWIAWFGVGRVGLAHFSSPHL